MINKTNFFTVSCGLSWSPWHAVTLWWGRYQSGLLAGTPPADRAIKLQCNYEVPFAINRRMKDQPLPWPICCFTYSPHTHTHTHTNNQKVTNMLHQHMLNYLTSAYLIKCMHALLTSPSYCRLIENPRDIAKSCGLYHTVKLHSFGIWETLSKGHISLILRVQLLSTVWEILYF